MPSSPTHNGYMTRRDLEARGWTRKMIKTHLEPYAKCRNEDVPFGALMNLFKPEDVLKAEATKEFRDKVKQDQSDSAKRLAGTLRWAKNSRINLTDNIQITALADSLGVHDAQTLVAFIRHKFSNYTNLMDACNNRAGTVEAKKIIRLRLLRMISKTYPGLKHGCYLQWGKWYSESLAF